MDDEVETGFYVDVETMDQEGSGHRDTGIQAVMEYASCDTQTEECCDDTGSNFPSISIKSLSAEMIKYYAGFDDFEHFKYAFDFLGPAAYDLKYKSKNLEPIDEFLLTVLKLRQDKDDTELGFLFGGLSRRTVSRIFTTWINFIYYQLKELKIWLDKEIVQEYMPEVINFFWL